MLTVLIHSDDPVSTGRSHTRECCRMLTEVPTKPNSANNVVSSRQLPNHLSGLIGTMIENEQNLCNDELVSRRRPLKFCQVHQLGHNPRQRLLPLIDGNYDGDTMGAGRQACHWGVHVYRVYRLAAT